MADDNLLATLEGSLRQTRATRARLHARLLEIELEAEKLRTEIGEMDQIAGQTEAAMFRIMSSVLSRESAASSNNNNYSAANNYNRRSPSDREIEAALREDQARAASEKEYADARAAAARPPNRENTPPASMPPIPISRPQPAPSRHDAEAHDERFLDRTIPQAAALLLRESSVPLHVNEIYTKLCEGGFQFTGQNPTISIAVSLNRNRRFRKVAPGTFDLMIRDAAQAS